LRTVWAGKPGSPHRPSRRLKQTNNHTPSDVTTFIQNTHLDILLDDGKNTIPQKRVLTFTDRGSGDLPVFQLVVDADHQHVVPRNPTEGRTRVLVVPVAPGDLGFGGPDVAVAPDPVQEVFQSRHEDGLTAPRDWDLDGVAKDGGAERRPRVWREREG